jgi:hypothetical protein
MIQWPALHGLTQQLRRPSRRRMSADDARRGHLRHGRRARRHGEHDGRLSFGKPAPPPDPPAGGRHEHWPRPGPLDRQMFVRRSFGEPGTGLRSSCPTRAVRFVLGLEAAPSGRTRTRRLALAWRASAMNSRPCTSFWVTCTSFWAHGTTAGCRAPVRSPIGPCHTPSGFRPDAGLSAGRRPAGRQPAANGSSAIRAGISVPAPRDGATSTRVRRSPAVPACLPA